MTIDVFTMKIADLCESGISVTSWFRSKKRNAAVGGLPNSKHLVGLAVDILLDDKKDKPGFLYRVKESGLSYLDEGSHIHVQVPRGK